jgi:PAS domain S-box-containing protein
MTKAEGGSMTNAEQMPNTEDTVPSSGGSAFRVLRSALPLLAAVLALGGVATWRTARVADRELRARLLTEASMVAQAVKAERVLPLTGSEADLTSAEYQRLKEQLMRIRSVKPACRFIYLMGQRSDKSIFFFVDSEPPESKDYSPPGQPYEEISAGSLSVFTTQQSATVGPEADRWGTWVSAVVPLVDFQTKRLIAVLGMDVDARAWTRAVVLRCTTPASVTVMILIILGVVLYVQRLGALEQQRLVASEVEYRTLFDASRDANLLLDKSGFLNCNRATLQMFGCRSRDDVVSKHPADWSPPTQPDGQNSRAAAGARIEAAFATGGQSFEWMHRRADGTTFPAEVLLSRMEYHGKSVLLATVRDITARKQTEMDLREQEAWKQSILDTSQTGFVIVSVDSRKIVDINRAAARIIGAPREAIVGRVCHQFICPAEQGQCPICDLGQPMENRERVLLTADGRQIPILKTATVMTWNGQSYVLDSFVDISERVAMESALRQQHTLTSIGTLARGMAHEINNPIMGVMNYAQLIKDRAGGDTALARFAAEIVAESTRVATMTHGLLTFTERQEARPFAPAIPAEMVASVLTSAGEAARERGICLSSDIPAQLSPVKCRQGQIEQVMTALLANAMESWGEGERDEGRGSKEIRIRAQEIGERSSPNTEPRTLNPEHFFRIIVEDNGPGIKAEIRERVFDPCFTTKDRTQHSGLGLWIGRSIVQEHGGELTIETEEGKGTRVYVDLPAGERETLDV